MSQDRAEEGSLLAQALAPRRRTDAAPQKAAPTHLHRLALLPPQLVAVLRALIKREVQVELELVHSCCAPAAGAERRCNARGGGGRRGSAARARRSRRRLLLSAACCWYGVPGVLSRCKVSPVSVLLHSDGAISISGRAELAQGVRKLPKTTARFVVCRFRWVRMHARNQVRMICSLAGPFLQRSFAAPPRRRPPPAAWQHSRSRPAQSVWSQGLLLSYGSLSPRHPDRTHSRTRVAAFHSVLHLTGLTDHHPIDQSQTVTTQRHFAATNDECQSQSKKIRIWGHANTNNDTTYPHCPGCFPFLPPPPAAAAAATPAAAFSSWSPSRPFAFALAAAAPHVAFHSRVSFPFSFSPPAEYPIHSSR
jgi:hypothetical protein